jgi:hypothetical protein
MNNIKETLASLIIVISIPGIYFSYRAIDNILIYFHDSNNSVRHEYLILVFWFALAALLCWLFVSGSSIVISKDIPKILFYLLNIPFIVTSLGLIYWTFASVITSFI